MMRVPPVMTVNGALTVDPWVSPNRRGVWHKGRLFSTFFGGNTPDWNSPQDQFAEFADFEIFG